MMSLYLPQAGSSILSPCCLLTAMYIQGNSEVLRARHPRQRGVISLSAKQCEVVNARCKLCKMCPPG